MLSAGPALKGEVTVLLCLLVLFSCLLVDFLYFFLP